MDTRIVYFLLLSCASVFAQDVEIPCEGEQIKDTNGDCVDPIISRNIYVFAEPEKDDVVDKSGETKLPKPKLEYNIVFVRAPERGEGSDPIVVPPPQQKTIVYVLSKKGEDTEPKIIEIPAAPKQKPEVYYVNYAEGDNPELPGGVDLQTALDTAAQPAGDFGTDGAPAAVQPAPATGPLASTPGTSAAPTSPAGYTPPTLAPQQPNYVYVPQPQPQQQYVQPQQQQPQPQQQYIQPQQQQPQPQQQQPQPQQQYIQPQQQQPQPQQQYIQRQNVYLGPQQGGLGNFQPLGYPTQQG